MYNKIPIAIQCVPRRKEHVDKMMAELKRMGFINVIPFYDHEYKGTLHNFKRIMSEDYGVATHLLVLQDDVIFAENFAEHLTELVKLNHHCISLFAPPRKVYKEQLELGTRLYIEKNFLWCQAVLYRTDFRLGLIAHKYTEAQLKEIRGKHDDVMVGQYAKDTKQHVLITIPSIVQHDIAIPSTLGTASKIGSITRESSLFYTIPPDYFKQS
jgi:hypothetical protein